LSLQFTSLNVPWSVLLWLSQNKPIRVCIFMLGDGV
jgi:hypothetical protein